MTRTFFRKLKGRNDPKEAIRDAREEMRKAGYEHPFYWASFILVSI